MRILSFFALALGLPLATLAQESRGDVVVDWNAAMTQHYESLPPPGVPPVESRVYAMAHLAMFNAANATNGRHASTDAAIAQAAHDVLAKSVPDAPEFDRLLARQLVAIPDGAAKAAGIRIGAKAADDELAARTKDGMAEGEGPYRVDGAAGRYRSTPPFDTHAPPGMTPPYVHFPNLGRVTPFTLE